MGFAAPALNAKLSEKVEQYGVSRSADAAVPNFHRCVLSAVGGNEVGVRTPAIAAFSRAVNSELGIGGRL